MKPFRLIPLLALLASPVLAGDPEPSALANAPNFRLDWSPETEIATFVFDSGCVSTSIGSRDSLTRTRISPNFRKDSAKERRGAHVKREDRKSTPPKETDE